MQKYFFFSYSMSKSKWQFFMQKDLIDWLILLIEAMLVNIKPW